MITTEQYLKHQRIIKNSAYIIAKKYDLEYADMEAQGNYIFCNVINRLGYFKDCRSLLKRILYQDLTRYAKKEYKNQEHSELSENICQPDFSIIIIQNEILNSISIESKKILNLLIEKEAKNKKELRKKLRQENWSNKKINYHFFEIQNTLKEVV